MMGATKDNITIKKGRVSITLYVRKVINESIILYLKAKRYTSEVFSHQESNKNMPEGKKKINIEMTKKKNGKRS